LALKEMQESDTFTALTSRQQPLPCAKFNAFPAKKQRSKLKECAPLPDAHFGPAPKSRLSVELTGMTMMTPDGARVSFS